MGFDGRVEIHTLPDASLILELPAQSLRLHYVSFSPDRQRLYLWQASGRLLEWDLAELRRELAQRGLDWDD